MELQQAIHELKELQKTRRAYRHALDVLFLDGVTVGPSMGAEGRNATVKVLTQHDLELFTNDHVGELLAFLKEQAPALDPVTLRETEELARQYDRLTKIPAKEYTAFKLLVGEAEAVWPVAKANSDFDRFAPYLERIVETNQYFASCYDASRPPYDVLLDEFEPGMTSAVLDQLMGLLKEQLSPLLEAIREQPTIDDSRFHRDCPYTVQKQLSHYLMELMGLDRSFTALGESEHPFSMACGKHDVRMTTHYYPNDFRPAMFSVLHEGGHSLYEHGIDDSLTESVLGYGVSAGVHEAQSRFYENYIGRSRSFLRFLQPKLTELFPDIMSGLSEASFYRAINRVEPGCLRLQADELTYPFHIIIRYELEKRMVDGSLSVRELPAEWNRLYKAYLGVDVPDDRTGVLQDCHWSDGGFGYFPTYVLGSAYAAQILAAMQREIDVDGACLRGDLEPVTHWLTEHVFRFGSLRDPAQTIAHACGAFDPMYYVRYLKEKYSDLYELFI